MIIHTAKEKINWNQEKDIVPEKEGILSLDYHKPVDLMYADQFVVNTPGCLPTGCG